MKNILKQFVELDIPSNQSNFKKAVIKLTVYYTLGVFMVLAIFNLMVYGLFSNSISHKDNEKIEKIYLNDLGQRYKETSIQEVQDNLLNILLFSDTVILLITIIVAYISSKKTLAPLEEAYKRQVRFVSDAAHELRTPLSVMKAGSEVILRQPRKEEDYIKFINESLDEIKRLTDLSNDLLFIASNHKNVKFDKFNFSELCIKQSEIMDVYAKTKKVHIENEIEKNIEILGSKNDLARLIMNLLKNAVDYNKEDGNVSIYLKKDNNKAILTIKDSGIGINDDDIKHIFERFYKADVSRTKNSSSSGLGLSISKEIIDEHKGNISVKSVVGEGTSITVEIPTI